MTTARGASAATGQMVICTGTGPVVVYVDANGQPTAPPHICPDCMLAFDVVQTRLVVTAPAEFSSVQWHAPLRDVNVKERRALGFQSRAPPQFS